MFKNRFLHPVVYILLACAFSCHALAAETDTQDAAELYHDYCSVCHGDKGDGNSRAKQGLVTPPRDFTQPGLSEVLSRDLMIDVVLHGRPGTAMAGWSTRLSIQQAENVVDFIRNNFMMQQAGQSAMDNKDHGDRHQGISMQQAFTGGLEGDAENGKQFYEENCATCHGIKGDGNGPRAYFIFPKPRNFLSESSQLRLNRVVLFNAIKYGIRGKEMPAWGKVISDQQIANVAEYVFTSMVQPETGSR